MALGRDFLGRPEDLLNWNTERLCEPLANVYWRRPSELLNPADVRLRDASLLSELLLREGLAFAGHEQLHVHDWDYMERLDTCQQEISIISKALTGLHLPRISADVRQVPTEGGIRYGRNFRRLRDRAHLSQTDVAAALGYTNRKNANISSLENGKLPVPLPKMIRRHAKALNCEPNELLEGVRTPYDDLRHGPAPIRRAG